LVRHEVVDVEVQPLESVLDDAVDRDAAHRLAFGRDAHARPAREHPLHLALVVRRQRGAQLAVDALGSREPARLADLPPRVGDRDDIHGFSSPSLRNISLIPRTACRVRASFSMSAMRTWSSPYSPKPTPGETATFASVRTFLAKPSDPSFA